MYVCSHAHKFNDLCLLKWQMVVLKWLILGSNVLFVFATTRTISVKVLLLLCSYACILKHMYELFTPFRFCKKIYIPWPNGYYYSYNQNTYLWKSGGKYYKNCTCKIFYRNHSDSVMYKKHTGVQRHPPYKFTKIFRFQNLRAH